MFIDKSVHEYGFSEDYHGTQTIATCLSIWKSDDKVSQTRSVKTTGINRHSGKRYYRWKFDGSVGLRRTSTGKIMPYSLTAKRTARSPIAFLNQFTEYQNHNLNVPEGTAKFFREINKHFKIKETADLYPVMKFYDLEKRDLVPQPLLPFMRHTDYKEFVSQAYGKKNLRRDLVKAAAGTDLYSIVFTRPFRNTVPVDWIIRFMRNNDAGLRFDQFTTSDTWLTWNRLVPSLNENTKRALLNEVWEEDTRREFEDTMIMVRRYPNFANTAGQNRYRTIHELHEAVRPRRNNAARAAVPRPVFEDKEVEYTWDITEWHDVEVGDMTIKLVEDTKEMSQWSEEMRNCISSYKSQALNGSGIYGAIHRGDKLIGNFEAKQGRLSQLLGKANSKMSKEDIEILESFFAERGLDVSNYWGKPSPEISITFNNVGDAAQDAARAIENFNAAIVADRNQFYVNNLPF